MLAIRSLGALLARNGSRQPLMLCKCFLSLTCTLMLQLTETVLFYWDFLDELYQQSIKDNISGIGQIEDWADKIISAKPVHTLITQRSHGCGWGSQQASWTASSTTNFRLKGNRGSLASTMSNAHVSTIHSNASLNAGSSNAPSISYIDDLDEDGSQSPPSTQPELSHCKQAMVSW